MKLDKKIILYLCLVETFCVIYNLIFNTTQYKPELISNLLYIIIYGIVIIVFLGIFKKEIRLISFIALLYIIFLCLIPTNPHFSQIFNGIHHTTIN